MYNYVYADLFGYKCKIYYTERNNNVWLQASEVDLPALINCCLEVDDKMTLADLKQEMERQVEVLRAVNS